MYQKLFGYFILPSCLVFGVLQSSCAGDASRISAGQLKAMMEKGEAVTVIDVRTTEEYNDGHIPGSISIHSIPDIKSYHYDGKVVLYCTSGVRSEKALKLFAENGVKNVFDLEWGIKAWASAGGNVVKGPYKEISEYPESFEIPKGVCETKEPTMKIGK